MDRQDYLPDEIKKEFLMRNPTWSRDHILKLNKGDMVRTKPLWRSPDLWTEHNLRSVTETRGDRQCVKILLWMNR